MAFNKDQNEPKVPISNVEKRESSNLLPRFYRTKSNKKFLQATLDQLNQPGTVKKLNGYIGRQNAKAVVNSDIFLAAPDLVRQNYQFEPAAIGQDYLGNTTFFKDYIDHINHVDVFDGITTNHSRLNREEFYSWNPHICWDKFVNYQQYFWLPFGPRSIEVLGQQKEIQSTFTVKSVDESDNVAYLFTPNGLTRNPALRLFRGQTYVFDIDAEGHPFSIKTRRTGGNLDRYTYGVDNFAVESGKITFTIPLDAPDVLFYVSENAVDTGGVFYVLDIKENTEIDLVQDFIGKKDYTIPNGTAQGLKISNGMKLSFGGQVTPEQYGTGYWYVEGVGTAITLVSEKDLEVRTSFNQETNILFDDAPFDQLPFGDLSTLPSRKDYIIINRASPDKNAWSRYNRWFHKDVIVAAAAANGVEAELDQSARAIRPIIEFVPGLKLFNYGISAKQNVDLIDNFTKDAFSTVEGSLGYNIDGINLADGMRVVFNADTDKIFVAGKIFKVNFVNVIPPQREIIFNASTAVNFTNDQITFTTEHGLTNGNRVTYIVNDNDPIPGLTNRQIYYVGVIDTFKIQLFTNASLTKTVDIFAAGLGNHKFEIFSGVRRQINLVEETDATPETFETVTINYGTQENLTTAIKGNQGQTYWYNGTSWQLGQLKTSVNQQPLFDLFDSDEISFGNSEVTAYEGTSFLGNKIFSYKVGTGAVDSELGFALSYLNINNIGDIVFEFDLLKDSFAYKDGTNIVYVGTDVGYLKIAENLETYSFSNGWVTSSILDSQPAVRIYQGLEAVPDSASKDSVYVGENGVGYQYDLTSAKWYPRKFQIDIFDKKDELQDLTVRIYLNGKRWDKSNFTIEEGPVRKYVNFVGNANVTDVVTLKCFTKQAKNYKGHYEVPGSLQNNPLNNNISQFTLGEVIDHVDSIIDNITEFNGIYPGPGNLRDIGELSSKGTKFVQHSGPLALSLYHLGSKNANIVKALDDARNDYGKFKRAFIIAATESGIDTDPRRHVDVVLQTMVKDKPKSNPYYLSDMFGYTASNRIEYTIIDPRIKTYPLTKKFVLSSLSNKAVNIYLNGEQLLHGKDYLFGDDVFFELLIDLEENDLLEAFEYESTDGCHCPATPTKYGLYPKFEPRKYIDDTYSEPTEVIQGHDGSITVAFGDYRDDLILELEKRIFNNIKCEYDADIFDIYDFIPGYDRVTAYTRNEFNQIMAKYFFQWATNIQQDYTKHYGYNQLNSFTFNYRGNYTPDKKDVPAAWRGIYKWLLDTDRPHTHPWECLGFSLEPKWWQEVYGPVPYTSDNLMLWDDIKEGVIRQPGVPVRRNPKFAKSILSTGIPVDNQGKLISPYDAEVVSGYILRGDGGYFVFGDQSVVETAWRRSSYFPFGLIQTALLMQPNHVLGRCLDRSRIERNKNNQFIYKETGLRIRLQDIVLPSTYNRNNDQRVYTSGLINYVIDHLSSENISRIDEYENELKTLTVKMSSRLGAFTNKEKYKILLDSKTPSSSGGVFVPEENYFVDLNVSSAVKKVIYSGVVITKYEDGFEIRGYNFDNPYFVYYPYILDNRVIRVGGISESYINWNPGQIYVAGKLIKSNNQYYRVKTTHTSGEKFDDSYFVRLPELPIQGGREVMLRETFNSEEPKTIAYGTKLYTIQDVTDFLQGYGAYLENQGFVFDDFNNELATITNWETSVKEFMFWTTQNWAPGAVLSLSPAASKLILKSSDAVVNDVLDQFYGYSIFRVDGQKLDPEFIQVYRSGNEFVLEPDATNYGIYGAVLYLVQKEHILVLDNKTLFNDTIYDQEAGYRQDRVKVIGYVTSNWSGGFEIPGFIYDQAVISAWEPWKDYNLGDIIKHKEFYYSAKISLIGTEEFNSESWVLLFEKPTPKLLPNLDYRAEQFTDFYDLDTDNLDSNQQKIAQHLIGYQKRQYLENIIQNDVSQYKFYQGMIIEKGTQNVLNKLFDVLSADGQESLTFDEEWAVRVGEYGAVDTFNELEFRLDESKFLINPQPIELVDTIDINLVDFVYRQKPSDVYIKPLNYVNDIWPTTSDRDYLRTPGYTRKDDVLLNIDTLADVITRDIDTFSEGDYVWCAFETKINVLGDNWNVYRFTSSIWNITNVTYANKVVTVTTDSSLTLVAGQIIGINNSALIKGFHAVTSVIGNKFTFTKNIASWQEFKDQNTVTSYVFNQQRVTDIDNANSIIPTVIKPNELIWADNSGNGAWAVYENKGAYRRSKILNQDPALNLNFGLATTVDYSGNICAVADENKVTTFEKGSSDNQWLATGRIFETSDLVTSSDFGSVLKLTDDANWLVIGAPNATAVKTALSGRITPPGTINYTAINNGIVQTTSTAAEIITGTPVRLSLTTGLTGVDTLTTYYVYAAGASSFRIAATPADAVAQIPVTVSGTLSGIGVATFLRTKVTNIVSTSELVPGMSLTKISGTANFGTNPKIYSVNSGTEITVEIEAGGTPFVAGLTLSFYASGFANQGYISLYARQPNGEYSLTTVFKSPIQALNEKFGSNISIGKKPNPSGVYPSLTGNYSGSGSGAQWMIIRIGSSYSVKIQSRGLSYAVGDTIVIPGSLLGGQSTINDLTITVVTVNPITGSIENFQYLGYGLGDNYFMAVSAIGYSSNRGRVYIYRYTEQNGWQYLETLTTTAVNGDFFGFDTAMSGDAATLIVSAPQADTGSGKVFVYNLATNTYGTPTTVSVSYPGDPENFGNSIAISKSGDYLAVGANLLDTNGKRDSGKVFVYKKNSLGTYALHQQISSRRNLFYEKFGSDVEFMNDDRTLVLMSGLQSNPTTFDNNTTTIDSGDTSIAAPISIIEIYDRYNTKFIYGETPPNSGLNQTSFGNSISVGSNTILIAAKFELDAYFTNSGAVYSYVKTANTYSWTVIYQQLPKLDLQKIKKIFLYNSVSNEIVKYLDVVNPVDGQIPGIADQEIRYKTYFDPATYTLGTSEVSVDDGMAWTTVQVGQLWWDLTRAKFIDTRSGDIIYRTSVWNKLYDTASIDVYEWVESKVKPSEWNLLQDTEKGLASNISGTTKYGDEIYSIRKRYDSISKTFKETYYFWVKNKKTIPAIEGRTLAAYNISQVIADPISYGYSCLALTGTNSFSLVNCERYLESTNVVLSVEYWTNSNRENNLHRQWKLLSTNRNTVIPSEIESKWIHSLVGKDENDRVIPDPNLPLKKKYGIEFRPRQSMFVNRIEAVKQYIERVNSVLKNKLIANDYDLTDLNSFDPRPSTISGLWDTKIDTELELRFVSTAFIEPAAFLPIILDGRIIGVTILHSGRGYGKLRTYQVDIDNDPISWYGPNIFVSGIGTGAVIKTVINSLGEIIDCIIENSGNSYDDETRLTARSFSVLVQSDSSALDSWSIYSWDYAALEWSRVRSQSFDVRRYWNYVDWYDTGYNQFVKIDHLVENTYELVTRQINVGEVAKVKNIGTGGWLLLEKIAEVQTIDYTVNFKVIGRENGTIRFLSNLYSFTESTIGFDGPLFDGDLFDNSPTTELRIIANTIKNKLLIDEYYVEYLRLFFASVRYAVQEQTLIDWAFKTSFVKAQHNVGELKQKVTYNSDNLEFFEQYIKEVKPYRTKVREYVSNYSKLDHSQTMVTDFDLLPVINQNQQVMPLQVSVNSQGQIVTGYSEIDNDPWLSWKTELGFTVTTIKIVDGGSGYLTEPLVEITGIQLEGGQPAVAKAYITNGKLNRIQLSNGGTRWASAPTVTIRGGLSPQGSAARAVAIIGNSVPRTNLIKIKFDRINKIYEILNLTELETFTGTGAKTQFLLRWSPDIVVGKSYVTVNNVEILRDDYTLSIVISTSKGFTSYTGMLTFKTPPAAGTTVLIEYNKDFNHLSATDRINFYYDPTTGQLGKDLAQLMTGVDYGGVSITGIGFGINVGWDALPWFTDSWDSVDSAFEDYIVSVSGPTTEFRMPYVPALDQNINIYVSRYVGGEYQPSVRIDDPNYATINQTNDDALMKTFVGDGEIDIIILPVSVALNTNDRVIFRKDTSDGTYNFTEEFDTQLQGGAFTGTSLTSATGLAPEDILVDGEEQFVTATSSHAPEEVVPGQIMDAVAIKVYHRPSGGCPNILFNNHRGDATTVNFKIGQNFPGDLHVIVKVNNLIKTVDIDYTIDYQNNNIIFNSVPNLGDAVDIISIGFNSASLLDFDYFISDGTTTEYITKAVWLPTISSTVLVNGEVLGYVLFSTDDQYTDLTGQTWRSRAGIRFEDPPPAGALITYMIDTSGVEQTASVIKKETVTHDGIISTYTLANLIGVDNPWDLNILVRLGQTILKPRSANYFVLQDGVYDYNLKDYKYIDSSVSTGNIVVYRDATKLRLGTDYTVNFNYTGPIYSFNESTLGLSGGTGYSVGDALEVVGGTLGVTGTTTKFEVSLVAFPTIIYSAINSSAFVTTTTSSAAITTGSWVRLNTTTGLAGILVGRKYYVFGASPSGFRLADTEANALLGVAVTGVTGSFAGVGTANYDGPGPILELEIIEQGAYSIPPTTPYTLTGGTGTGATIFGDYVLIEDTANITVEVKPTALIADSKLIVIVDSDADYTIGSTVDINGVTRSTITFNDSYPAATEFEITSFYNHNVLGVERTVDQLIPATRLIAGTTEYYELAGKLGGTFRLRNTAVSGNFIWVICNGELLIHGRDYYLDSDLITVKINRAITSTDAVEVIAFTNAIVHEDFGYMQFKDMLNRVHYKRINKEKATRLVIDLNPFDKDIKVVDAGVLDVPVPSKNIPGVIEINGERIEYFSKVGNILSQLRRGTLGTGIPLIHSAETIVQGLGASETIPYKDENIVTSITADGVTTIIDLPYIPTINDVEVFVGGIRLKKNQYTIYSNEDYPYSPEGDITYPPQFSISGSAKLQLATAPLLGVKVLAVKRQGKLWNDMGERLAKSNNPIANFLKEVNTVWPESVQDKYGNRLLSPDGTPLQTGDGLPLEY